MKLKAAVSGAGVQLLEKELLPLLEKFGKTCVFLLRPDDVHFIQKPIDADGMHVVARCTKELFFEEGSYAIASRYRNHIAFSFEVALLRRVLSAATRNGVELLEMRLTMRSVPGSGGPAAAPVNKPFLNFQTSGSSVNMVQDLPISKPYAPSDVDRLVKGLECQMAPYYLDLHPASQDMQALVDKLRHLDSSLTLALTRRGSAHLQIAIPSVHFGAEIRSLAVMPDHARQSAAEISGDTGEARLREALRVGDALEVLLQLKHLQKCLSSSQLVQTRQLLCGIGGQQDYVHMLFGFGDPGAESGFELSYKLPVRDE